MAVTWIIYGIFGVLVCLLLRRVATQWKGKSALNNDENKRNEAKNYN